MWTKRQARETRRWSRPLSVEQLPERCLLSYTVTDLGTLGGTLSRGFGINNLGQVVGGSAVTGSVLHPFLWDHGVLQDLGTLSGSPVSYAYAINDSSQVVGTSFDPFLWSPASGMTDLGTLGGKGGTASNINAEGDVIGWSPVLPGGRNRAFLWQAGAMRDLGDLADGNGASVAIGINNLGEVVGQASTNGHAPHAFLWTEADGMTDLGTLDGNPDSTAEADAINDRGQIIGSSYSYDFNATHAVYYGPSGVIDLGTLGGRLSFGYGINEGGQVVGQAQTRTGALHAFLTDLTTLQMADLNDLIPPDSGWQLFDAESINDKGQITGEGTIGGQAHAYLLTPGPVANPIPAPIASPPLTGPGLPGLVALPSQAIPDPLANSQLLSPQPADSRPAEGMRGPVSGGRLPTEAASLTPRSARAEQPATDLVWAVSVGQGRAPAAWLDSGPVELVASPLALVPKDGS